MFLLSPYDAFWQSLNSLTAVHVSLSEGELSHKHITAAMKYSVQHKDLQSTKSHSLPKNHSTVIKGQLMEVNMKTLSI